MTNIGVFGSGLGESALDLFRLFLKDESGYAVDVLPGSGGVYDIIVCVEDVCGLKSAGGADSRTMYVVNPEHKRILAGLPKSGAELITCGFNGKDCVTASSVTETGLVICVQRNIPTVDGRILEPQEFAVSLNMEDKSPELALAVITALLAAGVKRMF
ncbi:MAG: hypothetical protein FWF44_02535 [Defluviitaleaceae bacterium]|nr:hypothetical protein [Defluviitaleaceae bacterium]